MELRGRRPGEELRLGAGRRGRTGRGGRGRPRRRRTREEEERGGCAGGGHGEEVQGAAPAADTGTSCRGTRRRRLREEVQAGGGGHGERMCGAAAHTGRRCLGAAVQRVAAPAAGCGCVWMRRGRWENGVCPAEPSRACG